MIIYNYLNMYIDSNTKQEIIYRGSKNLSETRLSMVRHKGMPRPKNTELTQAQVIIPNFINYL